MFAVDDRSIPIGADDEPAPTMTQSRVGARDSAKDCLSMRVKQAELVYCTKAKDLLRQQQVEARHAVAAEDGRPHRRRRGEEKQALMGRVDYLLSRRTSTRIRGGW